MVTELEVWEKCDEFDREVESMDLTEYEKQLFGDEDEEVKKSEDPSHEYLRKLIGLAIKKFKKKFDRLPTKEELAEVINRINLEEKSGDD
ncbi:hypothetical protein H6504_01315 [Candidatus Woesearchaeota archaeon]|nr:hypothetical protein [Candidatus Woesearchaeota archaeon]